MANPIITNSDTTELIMFDAVFADRAVTVGASDTLAKYTVLGIQNAVAATAGSVTTVPLAANLAALIAISDGEFTLTVDGGTPANITGVDMSSATSIAEVAAVLDAAVTAEGVTVTTQNGDQIVFTSDTTGASSAVLIEAYSGSGTDIVTAATLAIADATTVAGAAATAQVIKQCLSTATDGSEIPRMILMQELANATEAAVEYDPVRVMVRGEFNEDQVVWDNGTDTMATLTSTGLTMKDSLKSEGLYANAVLEQNILDNQ